MSFIGLCALCGKPVRTSQKFRYGVTQTDVAHINCDDPTVGAHEVTMGKFTNKEGRSWVLDKGGKH